MKNIELKYFMKNEDAKLTHGLDTDRLLKAEELAEILNVSAKTVRRWRFMGELRPVRIGKRAVRYRWGDVMEWINGKGSLGAS